MQIMDGITLCKKVKTNLETIHIPVILLTAKNELKSQTSFGRNFQKHFSMSPSDYIAMNK